MITPTITQFRAVIVIALVSWAAMAVLPNVGAIYFSEDVATARQWNYFGSAIPFWAIQVSNEDDAIAYGVIPLKVSVSELRAVLRSCGLTPSEGDIAGDARNARA